MTEEQIIKIIKLEAHKNLTIVDEGTDSYNDYVIRGVDLMAKSLVKLLTIHAVVGRSEQFCECDGVQDLIAGTGECRKCGGQCTY